MIERLSEGCDRFVYIFYLHIYTTCNVLFLTYVIQFNLRFAAWRVYLGMNQFIFYQDRIVLDFCAICCMIFIQKYVILKIIVLFCLEDMYMQ